METEIRPAGEADLEALCSIEKSCFSEPLTLEQLRSLLPGAMHELWLAEVEGKTLGYIGLMYVLDEGYIVNLAVLPDARRRGLGTLLLDKLKERAFTLGLCFLTLEVRRSNEAARRLYEKEGFSYVGQRRNYYDHPREDALLMTRYIKGGASL